MTIAEDIAKYVNSVGYSDIPKSTIHDAKRIIIDTFGCAIGATDAEPVRIATKTAQYVDSGPEATVLGTRRKAAPEIAAFVNGTMSRYLEYMDTYDGKEFSHPSDNVLPIFAVTESEEKTGKDALLGVILAYEIQARLADAASLWTRGWDHVNYGLVSVSAVASRIMGLSAEETTEAINIALSSHIAMRQVRSGEISMWKAPAFADAARNAIFAARLAGNGMTGPAPIFEGEMGFWKQVSGKFVLDTNKFGGKKNRFRIGQGLIKYYPVETRAQGAVWCAIELRRKIKALETIKSVVVGTNKAGYNILAKDSEKWAPRTKETADHSLPYVVAVALMDKKVDTNSFLEHRFRDRSTIDFMKKIKVVENPQYTKLFEKGDTVNAADIKITLKSSEVLYEKQLYPKGHQRNPVLDKEIEEKFRRLAKKFVSPEQTEFALEMIWNLENIRDVGRLFQVLA